MLLNLSVFKLTGSEPKLATKPNTPTKPGRKVVPVHVPFPQRREAPSPRPGQLPTGPCRIN